MEDAVRHILLRPAPEAARLLIGAELYVDGVGGRIVEAEAYTEDDPASHCYGGPRGRNVPMFEAAGTIYVYRSYGVHWCMNLVTGDKGVGAAVLLRALEPIEGIERMRERRPSVLDHRLCSGPGNLTKALGVDIAFNGMLLGSRVRLEKARMPVKVKAGTRIGLTRAMEKPWRFVLEGSRSISRAIKK